MVAPQLGIDPEDFALDLLPAIERSFRIKFEQSDFSQEKELTYGELYALVLARLPQTSADDCTSQQAFYKLRRALRPFAGEAAIRPGARLADLLPANPRPAAAGLQAELGMQLNLVTMPKWMEMSGAVVLLGSIALLPVALLAACIGGEAWALPVAGLLLGCFGFAILLFALGARLGQRLVYKTVGELATTMSARYYRQSRRNPATVNLREIKAQLDYLFVDMAGPEAEQLVPEVVW